MYQVLLGDSTVEEITLDTELEHLKLIPSDNELSGAEVELVGMRDRESVLKRALGEAQERHEFVLIDCPPGLSYQIRRRSG